MRVLFGISGSIAVLGIHAYLARLVAEPGLRVSAVMTRTAATIVNPAAIGAVLREPVLTDGWTGPEARPPGALVEGCDVLVVAPASATTLAMCASGAAANLVSACYLAHRGRTLFAPAMDPAMLTHPAVRRNLEALRADKATVLPCAEGFQVSTGRWAEGGLCSFSHLRSALGLTLAGQESETLSGAA